MSEHLAKRLPTEQLTQQAGMARRTFMRNYAAAIGQRARQDDRSDAARRESCGTRGDEQIFEADRARNRFGDAARMRQVFQRQLDVSPADYCAHFSSRAATRAKKFGFNAN